MKSLVVRPVIGTGLLLLVPLVMSILDRNKPTGDGWHWGPLDFAVMAALLFGAGLGYEYFSRKLGRRSHRVVLGVVIFYVVLAIWAELAVGAISQSVGNRVGSKAT